MSDDQGLIEMLTYNIDYFKSKPADLPKTTIVLDNGYHPDKLTQALEVIYPEIMTKIQCWAGDPPRFELSAKPSKAEKAANGQSGFVPVCSRWVIERSNAWVERCKSGCNRAVGEDVSLDGLLSVRCTKQFSQKF